VCEKNISLERNTALACSRNFSFPAFATQGNILSEKWLIGFYNIPIDFLVRVYLQFFSYSIRLNSIHIIHTHTYRTPIYISSEELGPIPMATNGDSLFFDGFKII
jgi:hypothetical protein